MALKSKSIPKIRSAIARVEDELDKPDLTPDVKIILERILERHQQRMKELLEISGNKTAYY